MLAEYSGYTTGPMYFDHPNALGSEQQWTNAAGSRAGEVQFYPWGQVWGNTTNGNLYQLFASLLWYDPETDGYQAAFRYYIPRHGRWLTPDPMAGDVTNPQSLNRYAYVTNNPTSLTDPLGLRIPYAYAEGFDCTTGVLPCAGSLGLDYLETGEGFTGGHRFTGGEWSPGYFNGDVGTGEGSSDGFGGSGLATLPLAPPSAAGLPLPQVQQQDPCEQTILNAVNQTFGTDLASADVQGTFANPDVPGGTMNIYVLASNLPAAQFNAVQTGRYPMSPITWVIGYGPTLHVTGQTALNGNAVFTSGNQGAVTSVLFTAHIDSAFAYNPIGALLHLFRDLLGVGGRSRCL